MCFFLTGESRVLVQLSSNRKLKGSKSASKGGLKFLSPIPFFLKISRIWSNRWHVFNVLQGMEQIKNEIKMLSVPPEFSGLIPLINSSTFSFFLFHSRVVEILFVAFERNV